MKKFTYTYYDVNEGSFPSLFALLESFGVSIHQSYEEYPRQVKVALAKWLRKERGEIDEGDLMEREISKLKRILTNAKKFFDEGEKKGEDEEDKEHTREKESGEISTRERERFSLHQTIVVSVLNL